MATSITFLSLYIRIHQRLKVARLIVENQILHIQPAVIHEHIGEDITTLSNSSVEVFVSCFGILLDSKVIKFNQNDIRLKTVELDQDFICLTYGTKEKVSSTKLLHGKINESELDQISHSFLYETGLKLLLAL